MPTSKLNLKKIIPVILILLAINNLIAIARSIEEKQSILFLIDISGSMKGPKIDSVKSATKRIVEMISPCGAEISVMGFCGEKDNPIAYRLNFTSDKDKICNFIDSLRPNGNTPLGAALINATYYIKANKSPQSVKQTIILLGDGRSDDNVAEALKELTAKKALVQCECIGFCVQNEKYAEQQLMDIAQTTHGEYYVSSAATNVFKAFLKTSIKAFIKDIPVEVRQIKKGFNFKEIAVADFKTIAEQAWVLDSIQINALPEIYNITSIITNENIQDTMPKALVFDANRKVSLFINNGTQADAYKKWIDGRYTFDRNTITINLPEHFIKMVVKKVDNKALVLCVNKYRNLVDSMIEGGELCDCSNKPSTEKPTILVYFSRPGCK
ncbi:MAG TPA: vWA domain-containing protein [Bacteroidales bacterium]|nr:vWA domain-containing protein [Bacteroidales bacterium]